MCRRLILLVSFVLAVGMVGSVRAATIFHWQLDGTPDANIVVDTDIVSDVNAYAIINEDGVGDAVGLFYGASNPWFNTGGTSADFQNDPCDNNRGYGLAVLDEGVDSPLDLSTFTQATIECFVQPYLTRQSVILRKNNSAGAGGIYYIDTRPAVHSYSGKGVFGVRLVGAVGSELDTGDHNSLCHDFPYDPCEWYHVALVWDGNNMKFYVDGQQSQELGARSDQGYEPGTGVSQVPFPGPIGDSIKALGIGCQDRAGITDPNVIVNAGQMFCGRIDEVRISDKALDPSEFLCPPANPVASNPTPINYASDVCPKDLELSWTPAEDVNDANGHDIYFGASPNDVNESADPCFEGYDNNSWTPPDIELGVTYYWRIDEVNDGNTWTGRIWQFTVEDGNARDPEPAVGYRGLSPDANLLTWTPSCVAASQDVYFSTDFTGVNELQPGALYAALGAADNNIAPTLESFKTYYWRVDTNEGGNGEVWNFKTGMGGVIMYYKFDGSQGNPLPSPITDSTGNVTFTKYVQDSGSLTYGQSNPIVNADSGTSADFDPCSGLYRDDTGENDPLRLDGWQYTIEMWVKPQVLNDDYGDITLIGKRGSWNIQINDPEPGENNCAYRWNHAGNDEQMFDDSAVEGEWAHVAAVYDRTDPDGDRMKFYLNGELEEDAGETDLNPANDANMVTIGMRETDDSGFDGFFDGLIDELRILDIALAPDEFLYPRATNPSPSNGEGGIDPNDPNEPDDPNVTLSWTPWAYATDHDVYFGTNYVNVRDGNDPNVYIGRVDTNSYDVNGLDYATTYYWRIDEVKGSDVYPGLVWQFLTKFQIIDPNLLLWYPCDETSGNWVHDNSGHGLHGYDGSIGDGWDPDGYFDGCLEFDDNIGFNLDTRVLSDINDGISISVWLDGYREDHRNCVLQAGAGDYYLDVIVPDGDDDFVYWRAGNDTNDLLMWDTATPKEWEGDWHHFVFIKDEDAETMSIYFDAALKKTKSGTFSTLSNIVGKPFKIGALLSEGSTYIGKVDDLRIYDYAIPKSKVEELFRGGDLALAWAPSPYDGQPDATVTADLIWKPGNWASSHEVYFGTSKQDVEDANNSWDVGTTVYKGKQEPNTYEPGPLDLDTTYFWRIDEVNDTNDDRWKGNLWRFKVANYIVIDDMEEYTPLGQPGDIYSGWNDGSKNSTGSYIYRQAVTPVRAEQSVKYVYDNTFSWGAGFYSEIDTTGGNLDPNNWTIFDGRILSLWFYGKAGNDASATEQMYVGLEDSDGTYAEVKYPMADMNDIRVEEWQLWEMFLSDFTNVNMAKLEKLFIGFGIRGSMVPGGGGLSHWLHFDDIRMYPAYCVPEKGPKADLSGNCIVDFADIEIMAREWLDSDVNLGEVIKPDANGLVGWWMFDEAAADTNIAHDYAGDNNGVIETLNVDVWWVAAGHDGNALEFDGGRVLVPDAPALRPTDQVTACAWVKFDYSQEYGARIVVKGADNKETFNLEVNEDDIFRFQVRDGNDPNAGDYPRYPVDSNELDHGEWIHLAGTFDGNSVKCYVNGRLEGTNKDANAVWFLSQETSGLAIGDRSDATDRSFIGTIDDVRVYNYALSLEEVAYIATDTTGIFSVQSAANLYNKEDLGERAVNLRDFAELAKDWLKKQLWPQ